MTLDSATIALFATAAQGAKADTALQDYSAPFLHLQDQKQAELVAEHLLQGLGKRTP